MNKDFNKITALSTIIAILCSMSVFAGWKSDSVGRYYVRDDGSYPINCQENIGGVIFQFDEKGYLVLHEEEIQKYKQTRIVDYVTTTITADGRNAKDEKVSRYYQCKIPQVSGYDSDKINAKLRTEAPKLIKEYLEDTEDFSDVKVSKMVKHTNLNNDSSYRIDNDYMVFKLSTYGNRNITIMYDLYTGEVVLE
ncbi:MAG: hypothetical protein IJP71_07020 [Lachnospiraceae bacterium]|nr:hypothetical protein [Lachnospiraceae bacterium]